MRQLEEIRGELAEVRDELETLLEHDELTDDQESRYDELEARAVELMAEEDRTEARNKRLDEVRSRIESGKIATEDGADTGRRDVNVNAGRSNSNPYDLSTVQTVGRSRDQVTAELRSRAATAVEEHRDLTDDQKQAVTQRMERIADRSGFVPNYVLRTGTPEYRDAIVKYMAGKQDLWTNEERQAVANAEEIRAAMSLTDANGGYAIPFTLDNNLILTNDGVTNPVRQVARQVTITTDSWNGLTSAGVTASWDGEVAEVSDDSPTFSQPSVTPKKAQALVQGSIEITQDYPGLVSDIQTMFADAKDRLEGAAFINGTGSNQPQGIITALDGGSSEVSPATAETFAVADVYSTLEALPPRFRNQNVAWIAELSTINAMRQFAAANNYHAFLTDLSAGQPRQLLGYPLYESSNMDAYADINAAATADHHLLVVGDWRQYLIVDRVGAIVEYIPHLFNTSNNLPDGRRGWYLHWRVGADSLVDGAFRTLNVATTA